MYCCIKYKGYSLILYYCILYVEYEEIESNAILTVEYHGSAVDIGASNYTGIKFMYKWNHRSNSTRARASSQVVASATTATGSDIIRKMKPLSKFLMNYQYVSVCFLNNL